MAREVLSVPSEPVTIRERRESDYERALRFMGTQYAKHLKRLWDECQGDPCEFGRVVGAFAGIGEVADHQAWIERRFPNRRVT